LGPDELTLRPVRPQDRARVVEMVEQVWGGHDYLPSVFDEWVSDPAGNFQAAELDGVVVAIHRLRPIGPGVLLYEGMRVDPSRQGRGIGHALLAAALDEARRMGAAKLRLVTANPTAMRIFEGAGFARLCEVLPWTAGRVEGGDPARVPSVADAPRLADLARSDPAYARYGGVEPYWAAPADIDEAHLARRIEEGLLRVNGRAFAGLSPTRSDWVGVNFAFGRGGQLQDLLMALRFEADADGMRGVWLAAPAETPVEDDLRAVGYDPEIENRFSVYAREL
jgi:GNAT superfamily N-acetyltransferase